MKAIVFFVMFLFLVGSCHALDQAKKLKPARVSEVKNKDNSSSIKPVTSGQDVTSSQRLTTQKSDESRMEDGLGASASESGVENKHNSSIKPIISEQDPSSTKQPATTQTSDKNKTRDGMESSEDEMMFIEAGIDLNMIITTSGTLHPENNAVCDGAESKLESIDSHIDNLAANTNAKIDIFENLLDEKLKALENKVEDMYNKSINGREARIFLKVEKEIHALTETLENFEASTQRRGEKQRQILGNVSHNAEVAMTKASQLLKHVGNEHNSFKNLTESETKRQTKTCYASWQNPSQCLYLDSSTKKSVCYRGMGDVENVTYQPLQLMRDEGLDRYILCDTKTDGGGRVVIQRRTRGDTGFFRKWDDYKNGFGTHPHDFWLGNEAMYNLTSKGTWELRIDFKLPNYVLYARYGRFKVESESDGYRLTIRSHSGTLYDDTSSGMLHSNSHKFSTKDRDNDVISSKFCAEEQHNGWWNGRCTGANLNGKWGTKLDDLQGMFWNVANSYRLFFETSERMLYARATEMKIRRL